MLSKPVVAAPIVGATKPHHLTDAVAAVDLALTDDEILRLEDALRATGPLLVVTRAGLPFALASFGPPGMMSHE